MHADFPHRHAAHCESGTVSALLRSRGLDVSEPMVFGIAGALSFIYAPFVKMGGMPLVAYRDGPRTILRNTAKRLGIRMRERRYRDSEEGMRALDALLEQGQTVGLQTSIYWLPYFPEDLRFQYNGHNLVAFAKRGSEYLLSDPVFEDIVHCPAEDLKRARFAKGGPFEPKGLLYYPESLPARPDLRTAAAAGIRYVCRRMLDAPIPIVGVRGIRFLANCLVRWPRRLGAQRARAHVGHVIRMQEEIGTGGAGFRFLYAAFLQEAAVLLDKPELEELCKELTAVGDRWREFAVRGAQLCKQREDGEAPYRELGAMLRDCAAREARVLRALRAAV